MEILPHNSTCLELSIAMPGFSPSPSSAEVVRRTSWRLMKQLASAGAGREEEESSITAAPRKKLRLTREQSRLLEKSFLQNQNLNPKEKEGLAVELRLMPRQVEVWFQNRRARSKMKQTEMECEYLKRWFGTLTEQNRRLRKEVEELRSMKVRPLHLTMCPRCDHVTTTTVPDKGPTTTTTTTFFNADNSPEHALNN